MADRLRDLDRAIDALLAGRPTADTAEPGLVELAAQVRALPAEAWPDPAFPARLAFALATRLAPAPPLVVSRRRGVRRFGIGLAAAAVVAVAVVLLTTLERPGRVGAATLARRAAAASTGATLRPVRFTQIITNRRVPGSFQPMPPPPQIVEHVTYASTRRWRVEAVVTQAHGAGTARTLTVRNGSTIVTESTSAAAGTTQSRRRAGASAGLPAATGYGATLDPVSLLRPGTGRCARSVGPVADGPSVAGRPTRELRIGPDPCPGAAMPEANGPAVFLVDAETDLVLDATVFARDGHTVVERVRTVSLTYGSRPLADAFRLPKPLPPHRRAALPLPPHASAATLRRRAAFRVLLPGRLPAGVRAREVAATATRPSGDKLLGFTVTYADAAGRALFQLYEAPAAGPSVRFPGRTVRIRPGLTGTYSSQGGIRILWWIEHGTYCSLQEGGASAGVRLVGSLSPAALRAVAASVR